MRFQFLVQDKSYDQTVLDALGAEFSCATYDEIRVAMAYVTVSGLRDLLNAIPNEIAKSQWLVGLDDAVTQPGAIDTCLAMPKSDLRVASFESDNRRFHPKCIFATSSIDKSQALLLLGSPNLTKRALVENAESVVIKFADSPNDVSEMKLVWSNLWNLGEQCTDHILADYKKKYLVSKKYFDEARKKRGAIKTILPKAKKEVLEDDNAQTDPTNANICWIECGNVTAMGRELEFKAEQALFFGLRPHGGKDKVIQFLVSDGESTPLRMKYQENSMWRLQMNNSVPEVSRGLRPKLRNGKLGRSPFVAVFRRTDSKNTYALSFLKLNSREFKKLRDDTDQNGTLGWTTAREYGWI